MTSVLKLELNNFFELGATRDNATIEKNASTTIFGRFMGSTNVYGAMVRVTATTAARIIVESNLLLRISNMGQEYLITPIKAETRSPPKREPGFGSRS